jgi:2-methylfumaryl-CoA hydratase
MPKDATPVSKTNPGRFFEDYSVGDVIEHAVPRTVSGGERALYHALYPARHALYSSDEFARACGLPESPLDDLAAFHIVFGKSVPDVSLNAVANLGYAEARWLRPVYAGDTIRSSSEVIGLKQNSSGKTGVVYVRTTGRNQHGLAVMEFAAGSWCANVTSTRPHPQRSCRTSRPVVPPTCW